MFRVLYWWTLERWAAWLLFRCGYARPLRLLDGFHAHCQHKRRQAQMRYLEPFQRELRTMYGYRPDRRR